MSRKKEFEKHDIPLKWNTEEKQSAVMNCWEMSGDGHIVDPGKWLVQMR